MIWVTFMGRFFWVSWDQSFRRAWFILGVSQDPSMCVHTPLWPSRSLPAHVWSGRSPDFRNEKYVLWAGLNVGLASFPFDLQGAFLRVCGQGGLLTSGMKSVWSGQGPASSLNCPASLLLEFQSIGNKSPVALPSGGPFYLLSDNEPLCIHHLPSTVIRPLQMLYHPHASSTSSHPFSNCFEAYIMLHFLKLTSGNILLLKLDGGWNTDVLFIIIVLISIYIFKLCVCFVLVSPCILSQKHLAACFISSWVLDVSSEENVPVYTFTSRRWDYPSPQTLTVTDLFRLYLNQQQGESPSSVSFKRAFPRLPSWVSGWVSALSAVTTWFVLVLKQD